MNGKMPFYTRLILLSSWLRLAASTDLPTSNCSFVYTDFCLPKGYDMAKPDKLPTSLDIKVYIEVICCLLM